MDPLSEHREGLASLIRTMGKIETLRAMDTELRGTGTRLQDEREQLLVRGDEVSVQELPGVNARLEIAQRRITGKALGIEQAGEALASQISVICARFQGLWRTFKQWVIAREKTKLLEQLVSGSDGPPLDFVVLHLRRVADIATLEITSSDAPGLAEQCSELLNTITCEPEFPVPAYVPPVVQAEPTSGCRGWIAG